MSDVLLNGPPPTVDAARSASDLAEWLGRLLDAARDRGDGALCRLIAGTMDDVRTAKA